MITTTTLLLSLLSLPTTPVYAADTPFPGFPSPWAANNISDPSWAAAYAQAVAFVSTLTLTEKVNLTTGTGWQADRCVGNTGDVPRLGFRGLCLMDGPVGVRDSRSRVSVLTLTFHVYRLRCGRKGKEADDG